MSRLLRPSLLLLAAVLLLPSVAYAQVGSVAGTVRDGSGGVMPGVTVEVTSPALIEKVRSTITDDTGCITNNPFQTNVRANASYTIPWVDVLLGVVYQSRPGGAIAANWQAPYRAAVWEPASASRAAGTVFNTATGTTGNATTAVNLLDAGDLYGERISLWDLNFQKNVRFAGKRVNFGVQVYNLFNSDAATAYNQTYVATRLPNGTWVEDDPATPTITEVNGWGQITQIVNSRFARVSVTVHF